MRINVPSAPTRRVLTTDKFYGTDMHNAPDGVSIHRSPNALNMIRDVPGSVRKRMGFEQIKKYDGRINGALFFDNNRLIHAGTRLYIGDEILYSDMNDSLSYGVVFENRLYIFDGKEALVYGEFDGNKQIKKLTDIAYVPKIIISRMPTGGGTVYEPVNLISRAWKESYLADGTSKKYQLTQKEIDSDEVLVRIMDSDGQWQSKKEGTHFAVDRAKGIVTFSTAPPVPTTAGMDNVEITVCKTREGYADKINKCTFGILYGVNGGCDRLFLSGNPNEPDCDRYSALKDPTYFGDKWYSVLGGGQAAIKGYAVINGCLAAVREKSSDGRNIVIRNGTTDSNSEAVFPIINTLIGPGAVSAKGFGYLQNEPLFVTELGIYAVTSQDISGEKYSQNRSFYINSELMKEELENCFCCVYRDMFFCAVSDKVYILDGLQKTYESGQPYSSFQYECYIWDGIGARIMWEENGAFCFGREDGSIMRFYTDKDDPESYNDCGKPIYALWTMPQFSGHDFYKRKVFRNMAVSLSSAIRTSAEVFAEYGGVKKKLFDSGGEAVYLDFSYIDFENFNFSSDSSPHTFARRINIRRTDKVMFSVENGKMNEPFGVHAVAIEYNDGSKKMF